MATKLKILWQGDAPGLAEHRLSVAAFGAPLQLLLAALRRIASGIVSDAVDDSDYGARGGKYAKQAELLDLEIVELQEGSLGLMTECSLRVPPGQNFALFEDLSDRTALKLLDAVEAESKGHLQSQVVRKYLAALPAGVTAQRYSVYGDTAEVRSIDVGRVQLAEALPDVPFLSRVVADIVGVGFEPGKTEVRLRTEAGAMTCSATTEQVELALQLRNTKVQAMVVSAKKTRLLWIKSHDAPLPAFSAQQQDELLFGKWDDLLAKLAR